MPAGMSPADHLRAVQPWSEPASVVTLPQPAAETRRRSEPISTLCIDSGVTDIYLDAGGAGAADLAAAVLGLEALGLRAVCSWSDPSRADEVELQRVLAGCIALTTLGGGCGAATGRLLSLAQKRGMPTLALRLTPGAGGPLLLAEGSVPLLQVVGSWPSPGTVARPYAFMAVRIHDDFMLVRDALRVAVETELGLPCVYFEDRRVMSTITGVRERTAELIRGASFFVADLSYSPSSPQVDSPNTAHEIGMAQAWRVPLVVCAQAPRRNLYFSAGDLDTLFWRDEADLLAQLQAWLRPHRARLGRRVLAHELPPGFAQSRHVAPRFHFDEKLRYPGPPGLLARAWQTMAPQLGLPATRRRSAR